MEPTHENVITEPVNKRIFLLPHYFKFIGITILIASIIPAMVIKFMDISIAWLSQDTLKYFTLNAIIIGLLILTWTRGKIENESTFSLRLKIFCLSVIFGILHMILKPFVDLLFKDPVEDFSGQDLVLLVLALHLVLYSLQKKNIRSTLS
jgi:hypothetical protein